MLSEFGWFSIVVSACVTIILVAKIVCDMWRSKVDANLVNKWRMRAHAYEKEVKAYEKGEIPIEGASSVGANLEGLAELIDPYIPAWLKHLGLNGESIEGFIVNNPDLIKKTTEWLRQKALKEAPEVVGV